MSPSVRPYVTVSTLVFALVATLQALRALSGWPLEVNHVAIPLMASWGAAVVAGALAAWGWRSR